MLLAGAARRASQAGDPVKLNSLTGMIGMPTQQFGGILVRSLINSNIKIGGQVQINQADIQQAVGEAAGTIVGPTGELIRSVTLADTTADGVYVVLAIDYEGDTRGEPWYMDLRCSTAGQALQLSALGHYPNPYSISGGKNGL
jgi:hypothetical protein